MFTRDCWVHQNNMIIQRTSNSCLTAREDMYQPLFRQPACWISNLGACFIGRWAHPHHAQYAIVLTHACSWHFLSAWPPIYCIFANLTITVKPGIRKGCHHTPLPLTHRSHLSAKSR